MGGAYRRTKRPNGVPPLLPGAGTAKQRMYEALRAYFLEDRPSPTPPGPSATRPGPSGSCATSSAGTPRPPSSSPAPRGPRSQPKKSAARELIVALRKQNHSVYEISEELKERQVALSPTAVREVLKEEGFAPPPRRLDEERPYRPRPTAEPVADVRSLFTAPRAPSPPAAAGFSSSCPT